MGKEEQELRATIEALSESGKVDLIVQLMAQVAPLKTHRNAMLRCLRDPVVPSTNNLAERDIRMVTLRQKTSGCTRTFRGAQTFARIRSYISTSRKQHQDLFQNIVDAVAENPWMPRPRPPTP